jgi:hypothetical protein
VGIFRKKETYNEQMLREAGLNRVVFNEPTPVPRREPAADAPPSIDAGHVRLGDSPSARRLPPAWDTTTTAGAPGIDGDEVEFVVLPSGDLIITAEKGDGDLTPLADAIEDHLSPPYKAVASRQTGDLWGIGAKRIEVAEFAFPDADKLDLTRRDGVEELRIDDGPTDVAPPAALRRLGETAGANFFVTAQRIDGDYWEVGVNLF